MCILRHDSKVDMVFSVKTSEYENIREHNINKYMNDTKYFTKRTFSFQTSIRKLINYYDTENYTVK